MITPRATRLVRVPDLQTFRRAIAELAKAPVVRAEDRLIVIPTRGAGRIVMAALPEGAAVVVTRDELYQRLSERQPEAIGRLTVFERDSLMQAAAVAAAAAVPELSFKVRPGLVAEVLRFYDDLLRQSQRVSRFEELVEEAFGAAADAGDRGALRLRQQTRFLAAAFRGYEERLRESGGDDEHTLRARLLAHEGPIGPAHVIVAVADWIADPEGLAVADFDLLARVPGLERLDVIATEATLASGFHERLRNLLPGLEEIDGMTLTGREPSSRPRLLRPPHEPDDERLWFTCRDREEELVAIARRITASGDGPISVDLNQVDRIAVVARHPLPYLYLAPEALGAAGLEWQTSDALPLAAEPTAAAVDLILECAESDFTRDAIVGLLTTPHLAIGTEPVSREAIGVLNRRLSERRYLGGLERLESLLNDWESRPHPSTADALPALRAAVDAARELQPLRLESRASVQIGRLVSYLTAHLRPLGDRDPFAARETRARGVIVDTLERLASAHAAHHDPAWTIEDLGNAVRRWIGEQTFAVEGHATGLQLIDDQAARFGDFDHMAIVGLVEGEWPEQQQRNIFYSSTLLKALGWPSEKDRRAADDARFLDLLRSPRQSIALSTFTLDDESLVSRSLQLDEVPRAALSAIVEQPSEESVFPDEDLAASSARTDRLALDVREWAELRMERPLAAAPQFHGYVSGWPPRPWSVSALETYLACPFKFFAQHVLKLQEEPEDEEVMDPRRQGQLVHEVFESFFERWQAAGRRGITTENLDAARQLFVEVVDAALEGMGEAEAALERTRLLGSPAAAGLGEAVFRMEAERPTAIVERRLEHEISGEVAITVDGRVRTVAIRGKVDRLDLLEDGTFRLVDYKLGWPPNRARALQLPIYGLSAEQKLAGYRGRQWTMGEAVYLAFKGPKRVVPLVSSDADRGRVMADAQERLAAVIDAIERGEFPPSPDDVFRCETCSYSTVCRLDHVDVS